jgi:hypothetical protein
MEKLSKKTKLIIAGVGIVAVLAAGGGAYASNQSSRNLAAAQEEVNLKSKELKALEKEISNLFDEKSPTFLKENIQESEISEIKDKVRIAAMPIKTKQKFDFPEFDQEREKANKAILLLSETYVKQQKVNSLFQEKDNKKAINGSKVTKDLAISDDLKKESVEDAKNSVENPSTDFEKAVKTLAIEAENQLEQLDKATQATVKVYKDKVISTDEKLYNMAKTETDKVKNVKAKKALTDQLDKVRADIDKKTTEESKKQAATKEAASTDPAQQQQNGVAQTEAADIVDQTNQNATGADYSAGTSGGADTGTYVPQGDNGGGYQQPQSPAPAHEQPQAPATDGQAQNPPASTGGGSGSNNIIVNPEDIQGSQANNTGGTDQWWGWD